MNTDNSKSILVVGGSVGIKNYVQELLNKISSNVEVVITDELPMQEETLTLNDFYVGDPPYFVIEQLISDVRTYIPPKDTSFRGGNRKKGGKTKYKRN